MDIKGLLDEIFRPVQFGDPQYKRRDTAKDAAASMKDSAPILRDKCYKYLLAFPATADEVAAALNKTVLAVRPRISELANAGLIEDSGERRKNSSGRSAIVWRAR